MDERQQKQIELIVAHELDLARRDAEHDNVAIFAAHAAKGILGSGVTVKAVSGAIGTGSDRLLTTLVEKVGAVCRTPQSHAEIAAALEQHFSNVESEVVKSARMASRRGPGEPHPSILQAAMNLFEQIKSDTRAKLEIERFAFKSDDEAQGRDSPTLAAPALTHRNRGGKPLAAHWDAMWAHIAVQLWTGDLQPKTQADIKKAMFDWFNAHSIDVGDTPVTDRARQLWLAIEAER